jgi:hypothetical protein
MSMIFRYKLFPTRQAVVSLGGRWVRPRPVVSVSIIGPTNTYLTEGLLDSAADDTVLPERAAQAIGLDLSNAPVGEASGFGAAPTPVRYAVVDLRLAGNGERHEWPAWVAFSAVPRRLALFGFAGFLQFFTSDFRGDREEVELTINSLYPGT